MYRMYIRTEYGGTACQELFAPATAVDYATLAGSVAGPLVPTTDVP